MFRFLFALVGSTVLGFIGVVLATRLIVLFPLFTATVVAFCIGATSGWITRKWFLNGREEKPASLTRRLLGPAVGALYSIPLLTIVFLAHWNGVPFTPLDMLLLFSFGIPLGYLVNWCEKHPVDLRWIPLVGIVLWSRLSRVFQGNPPIQKKSGTNTARNLPRPHRR